MEKDIVPKFLGAHKGKEFFLRHNTESVRILHDFTNEKLAEVADGTYTRLEKSSNNEFQYVTYSLQKFLNHLLNHLFCAVRMVISLNVTGLSRLLLMMQIY
jgi:hypothetical protein